VTATTAAKPMNRRARTAPSASRLTQVMLGDLEVVAAHRFDRAVAAGAVGD